MRGKNFFQCTISVMPGLYSNINEDVIIAPCAWPRYTLRHNRSLDLAPTRHRNHRGFRFNEIPLRPVINSRNDVSKTRVLFRVFCTDSPRTVADGLVDVYPWYEDQGSHKRRRFDSRPLTQRLSLKWTICEHVLLHEAQLQTADAIYARYYVRSRTIAIYRHFILSRHGDIIRAYSFRYARCRY